MFARGRHFIIRASNGHVEETYSASSAKEAVAKVDEYLAKAMWCDVVQASTGKSLNGLELRELAADE